MRFPGFTEPWQRKTLGEVAKFCNERVPSSELTTETYVSTENLLQDFQGVVPAISVPSEINVMRYIIGDILISNIRPYLRKVWMSDKCGGCSADVFVLRADTNICDKKFLHYNIANDSFINYVMSGAKGVKMPRGDKQQIIKYQLSVPSFNEQQKIADFLDLLDRRIAVQSKIIERLQSLMDGIAQRLTAHLPNIRIADCLECHSSTLQENQLNEKGKYSVYGANGVCGYTDFPAINGDSILIVKDGSGVGNVSFVTGKYSVLGTSNYLTAKSGYNLRYLYYCLMIFKFAPYKTGMAIPHIYFKDYGKAKIYCPTLEEQERIAKLLSKIELKIVIERYITNHYIQHKQYLLHQMFI